MEIWEEALLVITTRRLPESISQQVAEGGTSNSNCGENSGKNANKSYRSHF